MNNPKQLKRRVLVYDRWTKKNQPATVVRRYSKTVNHRFYAYDDYGGSSCEHYHWEYPDLINVRFDHRPNEISRGHFVSGVNNA
jgi:hypothetical protein